MKRNIMLIFGRCSERLREKGLFVKLAKCEFLCPELKYLGHIIGKDGLKVDPQKRWR
jgi:hypothetical protein